MIMITNRIRRHKITLLNAMHFIVTISNIAACAQLEIVSSGDAVEKYSEIDAVRGHLGRFPGAEVMTLLQKYQHHITSST